MDRAVQSRTDDTIYYTDDESVLFSYQWGQQPQRLGQTDDGTFFVANGAVYYLQKGEVVRRSLQSGEEKILLDGVELSLIHILIQTEGSTSTSLFEVGRHNCEPFSDPTVMAAMGYALDKETINEVVYNNYGTVGWSPYPTRTKYYKEEEGNPYNIEKAKELLATTKWADGFEFDLCIDSAYPDWELSLIHI